MTTETTARAYGIAEVSDRTGLSQGTLRWYEKEGLVPPVDRSPDGRRSYGEREIGWVRLLAALRRTGMPVKAVRTFADLAHEGFRTHPDRIDLLSTHRQRVLDQIADLHRDLQAVDDKISHYRELIAAGLDCDGVPVPSVAPAGVATGTATSSAGVRR